MSGFLWTKIPAKCSQFIRKNNKQQKDGGAPEALAVKEGLMNKISLGIIFLLILFSVNVYLGYAAAPPPAKLQTMTADVNNDGKPDVTYHHDGKHVTKVEADTNYDGKPDVTVNLKDGKFESAQADTDYNGETDKKFSSASDFNKWLNGEHPDFQDKLNRANWDVTLLKF